MAKVILVGADSALLEGLAQSLLGFHHQVLFADSIAEIAAESEEPALIVASLEALDEMRAGESLPLSEGSALIIYGTSHDARPFLSPRLQRATLAYLVLPLERHRLVALAHSFDTRARGTQHATREEWDGESEFQI